MREDEMQQIGKRRGSGSSPDRIFFFRTISRQGDILIISIPKALYPMLAECGFLRRKLKITLEKIGLSEKD